MSPNSFILFGDYGGFASSPNPPWGVATEGMHVGGSVGWAREVHVICTYVHKQIATWRENKCA